MNTRIFVIFLGLLLDIAFTSASVSHGQSTTNWQKSLPNSSLSASIRDKSSLLRSNFLSSIKYWDFDEIEDMPASAKADLKESIIRELLRHEQISVNDACICSRILLPFVCDSNGQLHSNICRFHCTRTKGTGVQDIKPTMILTETPFQKSKELCQTRFAKRLEN